jgi:hypothetical protein
MLLAILFVLLQLLHQVSFDFCWSLSRPALYWRCLNAAELFVGHIPTGFLPPAWFLPP